MNMKKIILFLLIAATIIITIIFYYKTKADCYLYPTDECPIGCKVQKVCVGDPNCPECDVCIDFNEECVKK